MIVRQCPAIPQWLTEPCPLPERPLATNGDLADAYLDLKDCRAEDVVKLRVIRALAECRVAAETVAK